MVCKECGKQIADGSLFCSECGAKVEEQAAGAAAEKAGTETAAASVEEPRQEQTAGAAAGKAGTETAAASVEEPRQEQTARAAAEKAGTETAAASVEEPRQEQTAGATAEKTGNRKKKGKGGTVIAVLVTIVLLLAATVGGIFLFAREQAVNFFHVRFDKPEAYYKYVIDKNYARAWDNMALERGSGSLKKIDFMNEAFHESVQIKLGGRGKDFLKLAAGQWVDITWLDSIGFSYQTDMQMRNKAAEFGGSLFLNEEKIISGQILMDLAKNEIAMRFPELASSYVGLDMADVVDMNELLEEMEEVFTAYNGFIDAVPEPAELQKLSRRYAEIFLEKTKEADAERGEDTLEADGFTQECGWVSVTLKEKEVRELYRDIMEELAGDEEIKAMILKMGEAIYSMGDRDESPEELYENFRKECLDAISDEKLEELNVSRIKWTLFVNKKSEIIGMTLVMEPKKAEDKPAKFHIASLTQDDRIGILYQFGEGEDAFRLEGSGSLKDQKLGGDYRIYVNDKYVMKLGVEDYDLEELKNGRMVGRFNIKPGNDVNLGEIFSKLFLGSDTTSPAYVLLSALDLSLDLRLDVEPEKQMVEVGVLDGGLDIVRFSINGAKDESGKIQIPTDTIRLEEKPEDYLKEVKLDQVMEALKKAKVPEEYYEALKELEEYIDSYVAFLEETKRVYEYH